MFLEKDDPLKKLIQDNDQASKELLVCRGVMECRDTTEDQWLAMHKMVGLILLYGSDEIEPLARAMLYEITMRQFYMEKIWNGEVKFK